MVDANVACQQLGYHRAVAAKSATYFGQGTGNILLDDIECTGDETSIQTCQSKGWGVHDCGHSEDAGVVCGNYSDLEIEVRLVDKDTIGNIMGRVEVLYDGVWGTVCDDRFDIDDAKVICNQLGYPGANHYYKYGPGSTGPILLTNIECGGDETNLGACSHSDWYPSNCLHTEDIGVVCNQQQGTQRSSLPLYVIIAISVGATIFFLLIFTIVAVICCYCCSRKKTFGSSDITHDDTVGIIPPPNRQSVPLEEFHGRHSFMFVNTPDGVQMVTPERPGSYIIDSPPSTILYQEGADYLTPAPPIYKPPSIGDDIKNGPYLELGATIPLREQNGSLPRPKDHNANDNRTNGGGAQGVEETNRGSEFSQNGLTYDDAMQSSVPVKSVEKTNSNYVGDDESDEYTYVNPLPVSDEMENNATNLNKEVTAMIV
ncbi:uncharacterized protein [Amphiura filiformis]|uniref:uncharacterized protein isoform X2 n=1 Tax=Amphiura filiformis TaxID=82378 RepID=UPI003B21A1D8